MFPLVLDASSGEIARDPNTGEFVGCVEEGNDFMESEVSVDTVETTLGGSQDSDGRKAITYATRLSKAKYQVKELSRLWAYRNGKSPMETPPLLTKEANGVDTVDDDDDGELEAHVPEDGDSVANGCDDLEHEGANGGTKVSGRKPGELKERFRDKAFTYATRLKQSRVRHA